MGLRLKYYLLAGYSSQVSIFSLHKIKMSKQHIAYLSSKLSLTYRLNVNHHESVHIPIYSSCVGIGNTLVAFKTNE